MAPWDNILSKRRQSVTGNLALVFNRDVPDRMVEFEGFAASKFEAFATKFAPHTALTMIA